MPFVTPSELITDDSKFMRGHGTYLESGTSVVASVAGMVENVNRLVSVRPYRARYGGEIGDVVVGRITEVSQKRWKVDVNGKQDGVLMLGSVILPGAVQRRKSESDERQMRTFFSEGDLLVAEVQGFFGDSAASIHTRSLRYGKLRTGTLVVVPPALVERQRSHFHSFADGVDVILGVNGYVWVCKHPNKAREELEADDLYANYNETVTEEERMAIARVCNCIRLLVERKISLNHTSIAYAYEASQAYPVKDLLQEEVMTAVAEETKSQIALAADA